MLKGNVMTHKFEVSNLGTGDKCGVCGKTRLQHFHRVEPGEADPLRAQVRAQRTRIRALERAIEDLLHEFAGYRDDNEDEEWREPKVLQRARALLSKRATK